MTNRNSSRLASFIAPVIAGLLLASCSSSGDEDRARVTVISESGGKVNPIGINLNHVSATARMAVAKGLIGLDEQGRIVPSIAARWIVTDDGLSYIFRLNEARWNDGRQITAERIATLLRERIAELAGSRLGRDLRVIDEIVSMTGRVIEIRLDSPQPNFLQLLAQPELGLFRAGHGAGPMVEISTEPTLVLGPLLQPDEEADDEETDESSVEDDPRRVFLRGESAALAIARFDAGHIDVVLNGKFHHLPLIDASGIDTGNLRLDPVAGLFGLRFVRADGFWAIPDNREILSMAIDRPALLTSFPNVTAWKSRQKIIPEALDVEGINTRPDWATMTMQDRIEFARTMVARWKASDGYIPPLVIGLPDEAGADILFLRVQSDLRRIGLDAKKVGIDRVADVRLIDEIAPYDSPQWFLTQLTCDLTAVCLNDADARIADADAATNLEIKARLYAEAEQMLVNHYNYIPLGTPVRWSIARPDQRGFAVNPRGWHPLNSLVGIPIS
ncbi:ABC-type transport system, substrate-binding protein [Parasphingorhabdus marina DSM 22363]|uniref:ABC-type transport system, substrate-binding protein n=1 Tax=Parasphingorhabdus marina DSM 22363 TaxID=1123272 RepID=A0A1N6HG36_9SPHN|nr:ABC transporter substrate-binding protein [Parasphingorhabdus marina]SIO18740.1 ABC-type transport system, substrate-binding protein [Parasphingorhabdus marina DSM 22363]